MVSLVDQLNGKLTLKRNNGTEFTIRFTATEKNESRCLKIVEIEGHLRRKVKKMILKTKFQGIVSINPVLMADR